MFLFAFLIFLEKVFVMNFNRTFSFLKSIRRKVIQHSSSQKVIARTLIAHDLLPKCNRQQINRQIQILKSSSPAEEYTAKLFKCYRRRRMYMRLIFSVKHSLVQYFS